MSYFQNFPITLYSFGDGESPVWIQNSSLYVDLIDQIKSNITFYQYYNILEGERPDTLSYLLYDKIDYYWTFFLMNDNIRKNGWPLSNREVVLKAKKDFPHQAITTMSDISNTDIGIGTVFTGLDSGNVGTVVGVDYDNGQMGIITSGNFTNGEILYYTDENENAQSIVLKTQVEQYLSLDHYEDVDGNVVDVDPTTVPPNIYTPITKLNMYQRQNESLRKIVVIRPNNISGIVSEFKKLTKG